MKFIRIPREHWGKVWRALLDAGPIARVSEELIYIVSDKQVALLRKKKLPFELVSAPDGATKTPTHA